MNSPSKRKCLVCNNDFVLTHPLKKTCSDQCRLKRKLEITGVNDSTRGMANGTIGAIAELVVSKDLMIKRYNVFRALSPSCFCDLIIEKDGVLTMVEVRSAYYYKETDRFQFARNKDDSKAIDVYAACERHTYEVRYFDKNGNRIELL